MSFDLDVLRGWRENIAPELDAEHAVKPLACLVGPRDVRIGIHGLDVYLGRFHPQHGPVDILCEKLFDHELYRISAPHIRISYEDDNDWRLRHLSPSALTRINGQSLLDTREKFPIKHGDVLRLGVVDFTFEVTGVTYYDWKEEQKELLINVNQPSLFLMRAGSVCGPNLTLDKTRKNLIGRSFPDVVIPDRNRRFKRPDWDLAGLKDEERKFIGFRHVELWSEGEEWFVNPLTSRQRTFVNRLEVSGVTPLNPGDELALGSVLFHFHHPSSIRATMDRRTLELPSIVNWREERASRQKGEP